MRIFEADQINMCLFATSGFHQEVDEKCALLDYYAKIPYRRFGTSDRSHFQADISGQPIGPIFQVEDGTDRLSRNVCKESPLLAV
jgi:hypothetical protein